MGIIIDDSNVVVIADVCISGESLLSMSNELLLYLLKNMDIVIIEAFNRSDCNINIFSYGECNAFNLKPYILAPKMTL